MSRHPQMRTAPAPVSRRRFTARRLALALGVLMVLALVGYFAVGAYVATQLTRPERKVQSSTPADFGLQFQDTTVRARDGLALAGWFIPNTATDRAVVLVHGRGACRSCEFDGRFVEFAAALHAEGFNILMIDLRAHGQSEGRNFTLGEHERWDVLGAVDWLQEHGFEKIGVLGVSLGAASTVQAAVDPAGGQAIKAVVLDSSFGDLREVLEKRFPEESGLPNVFLPGSVLMGRLLLGANVNAIRPVDDLPHIAAPVMLIFGAQDDTVPVAQFHAMAAARPGAETWLVEDAGHARIYNAHPQEYVTRVSRFLAQALQ
ncbi:MAG: alpha/beta fold hydrolase [Chloroflexi bacterium]|nr:MAG: alpha/beta fold hydrolase [Chloroflexota bacterium]